MCVSGVCVPSRYIPDAYLDVRVVLADGREEEELPAFITADELQVTTQDGAGGEVAAQMLWAQNTRPGPVPIQSQSSHGPVPVQTRFSPGPVPVQSRSSPGPVPVQTRFSPGPVPVQSWSSPSSVPDQTDSLLSALCWSG